MLRRIVVPVGLLFISLLTFLPTSQAFAQNAQTNSVNNGNGLRISPVRNDVTIKPGESQTLQIYVQNITNSPASLRGIVNDFVASNDESGQPRILLNENDSAPSRGLKQYVDKISDFTLQPQEQKIIKVRVAIPANAAGGGYFGAVRFAPTSTNSDKNVSLSASVASLILVSVPGDVKEQVGIDSFNVSRGKDGKASSLYTNGKDLNAVIRFKNSGNIQEAPFGKINVKKSGKVIASYEINNTTPRGSVLPDSVRRFTTSLNNKTTGFGKYTVEGNFGYGNKGQLISASTSFFVLPAAYIVGGVLLLVLIIAAIVILPRMLKSHDRKLLRKVRRGRK